MGRMGSSGQTEYDYWNYSGLHHWSDLVKSKLHVLQELSCLYRFFSYNLLVVLYKTCVNGYFASIGIWNAHSAWIMNSWYTFK
jgi:hypothetical protein